MVVECEHCEARFQLDESRIPPQGIRARCSRCKRAFFLAHPSASSEAAVAAVVGETLDAAACPAPEPAEDLERALSDARQAESAFADELNAPRQADADAAGEGEDDGDLDWEFNLDPPAPDPDAEPLAPVHEQPVHEQPVHEQPVHEQSGSGLELASGPASPSGAATEALAPVPRAEPAAGSQPAGDVVADRSGEVVPAEPVGERVVSAAVASVETLAGRVDTEPVLDRVESAAGWPRVASGAGWVAVALLLGVSVFRALGALPVEGRAASFAAAGPFQIEAVETAWKAVAGRERLLVVRGTLHNPAATAQALGSGLTVVWLDEAGDPLDVSPEWAGQPLDEDRLRVMDAATRERMMESAALALAGQRLAGGGRMPFAAYLGQVPRGAARLDVRLGASVDAPLR